MVFRPYPWKCDSTDPMPGTSINMSHVHMCVEENLGLFQKGKTKIYKHLMEKDTLRDSHNYKNCYKGLPCCNEHNLAALASDLRHLTVSILICRCLGFSFDKIHQTQTKKDKRTEVTKQTFTV